MGGGGGGRGETKPIFVMKNNILKIPINFM